MPLVPAGAPSIDRSLKGRLRALIWRIVGPPLETQKGFNASLVDHLDAHYRGERYRVSPALRDRASLAQLAAPT